MKKRLFVWTHPNMFGIFTLVANPRSAYAVSGAQPPLCVFVFSGMKLRIITLDGFLKLHHVSGGGYIYMVTVCSYGHESCCKWGKYLVDMCVMPGNVFFEA